MTADIMNGARPLGPPQTSDVPPLRNADAEAALAMDLLTCQQKRVLETLIEGLSNKLIAIRLGISEATVKAHMSAILGRLGCANRTQAAILASRLRDQNRKQQSV